VGRHRRALIRRRQQRPLASALTRTRATLYLTIALNNRLVQHATGSTMPTDQLSLTFAALADPTRRAILARLVSGECSVTELAAPFDMSMPAVSKHLRVLERAGLVARGREAQWRPCRLDPAPLKQVAAFAEGYRAMWEQRFDRLESYLHTLRAKESRHARKPRRK